MRAILVKEFGDAEVMQVGEVGVPEPGRDEILVRILAAGVGPWDVEQRRGGWSGPLPYIPGREFAGLVVGDTGANAGFEDGTPVYGWPGPGGCYAQYVTCDVERLAPIPAGLRVTDAAAVPADTLTVDQGITDVLAVGSGDRVLITPGAGGPGHFAVQMARARGAVVVATASPRDHEPARPRARAQAGCGGGRRPDRAWLAGPSPQDDRRRPGKSAGLLRLVAAGRGPRRPRRRDNRDTGKGRASRSRPGPLGNV